ncbi:MAG: hypothetical protein ACI8UO_003775 [Verrucomicrobiales bacterium]|jgi:hypothetical protein
MAVRVGEIGFAEIRAGKWGVLPELQSEVGVEKN